MTRMMLHTWHATVTYQRIEPWILSSQDFIHSFIHIRFVHSHANWLTNLIQNIIHTHTQHTHQQNKQKQTYTHSLSLRHTHLLLKPGIPPLCTPYPPTVTELRFPSKKSLTVTPLERRKISGCSSFKGGSTVFHNVLTTREESRSNERCQRVTAKE